MSHRSRAQVVGLFAAALFAAWPAPAQLVRPRERVTVRSIPGITDAPLLIAKRLGIFADEGLDVELVKIDSSEATIAALVRGDVDVLPSIVSPALLNAIVRGARIAIVADKLTLTPSDCAWTALVKSPGSPLNDLAQLKGRRIRASESLQTTFLLDRMLQPAGVRAKDLQAISVPEALVGGALASGRLDVAFAAEPTLRRLLDAGQAVVWTTSQQVLPNWQYSVIVYGRRFLDDRPDTARRFMIAWLRALRQYHLGKTGANLEALAQETTLDRRFLERTCWPTTGPDGRVNVAHLLEFQQWALDNGHMDRGATAAQLWDRRFVDDATRALAARGQ